MATETPPYLPLSITTETRWGAARWRRVAVICALSALGAAGFAIAEKAADVVNARSAAAPPVGVSPGIVQAPLTAPSQQPATEAAPATATVAITTPLSPSSAVLSAKPDSTPAAAPEPPSSPTVLRGAGIKPR